MSDLDRLFERPLPPGGRGFLASLRAAGGRNFLHAQNAALAQVCRKAGYCHISGDGAARLTGLGQAWLDRIARAE